MTPARDWLAAQAASWIASTVLDYLSGRARQLLRGSGTEAAIRRAYESAIQAFLADLPIAAADFGDALERFFRDQLVSAELAVLLEPDSLAMPDSSVLRSILDASGFDLSTIPDLSFDVAIQQMTVAFIESAEKDDTLRSILHYRLAVETRLIVEEVRRQTASLSLDDLRAVLEREEYQLLAFDVDEQGDALAQFERPGRDLIVIAGSVQFSASLLALILNRLDRESGADW
jgi:hypothetical protein